MLVAMATEIVVVFLHSIIAALSRSLAFSFRWTSASGLLLKSLNHPTTLPEQVRSHWPFCYFHVSAQSKSHIWLRELPLTFFLLCKGICQSCSQQISSWPKDYHRVSVH